MRGCYMLTGESPEDSKDEKYFMIMCGQDEGKMRHFAKHYASLYPHITLKLYPVLFDMLLAAKDDALPYEQEHTVLWEGVYNA